MCEKENFKNVELKKRYEYSPSKAAYIQGRLRVKRAYEPVSYMRILGVFNYPGQFRSFYNF